MGSTVEGGGHGEEAGFDLPRGAGSKAAERRKAVIADERNDDNLAVAQTHLAFIRFHNRVVDTLPASVPDGAALRARAGARHEALPVDDPLGLPPPHLRGDGPRRRLHERPEGVRGRPRRRPPCRRCRSSSPSPRSGSGTRWSATSTSGTVCARRSRSGSCSEFSAKSGRPRRQGPAAERHDRGLPPVVRPRCGSSPTSRCGSTRGSSQLSGSAASGQLRRAGRAARETRTRTSRSAT